MPLRDDAFKAYLSQAASSLSGSLNLPENCKRSVSAGSRLVQHGLAQSASMG